MSLSSSVESNATSKKPRKSWRWWKRVRNSFLLRYNRYRSVVLPVVLSFVVFLASVLLARHIWELRFSPQVDFAELFGVFVNLLIVLALFYLSRRGDRDVTEKQLVAEQIKRSKSTVDRVNDMLLDVSSRDTWSSNHATNLKLVIRQASNELFHLKQCGRHSPFMSKGDVRSILRFFDRMTELATGADTFHNESHRFTPEQLSEISNLHKKIIDSLNALQFKIYRLSQ